MFHVLVRTNLLLLVQNHSHKFVSTLHFFEGPYVYVCGGWGVGGGGGGVGGVGWGGGGWGGGGGGGGGCGGCVWGVGVGVETERLKGCTHRPTTALDE